MSERVPINPDYSIRMKAAEALCSELMRAGLNYGCLEVALTALGATNFTLAGVERIDGEQPRRADVIDESGLKINWIVSPESDVNAQDLEYLFGGEAGFDEEHPDGEVAGYILSERHPERINGHSIATLPTSMGTYLVMDSLIGMSVELTAEGLAQATNYIVSNGGSFEIFQLKICNN
jgi:hypothetical protein